MRANLLKILVMLAFAFMAMTAPALVNEYSFGSSVGTFTEITGGSILGSNINDDESFNAIPLGFSFTFNGVQHTQISIQTDAFLAFGPTVLNSTLAISSATGTNNIASALNRDLMSRPDGELSYLLTGTAPDRVFIVQWKNYRRIVSTAVNDVFNFQIQLHENGNQVVFAYGAFSLITVTTAQTVQVGLRGDSNADFNNRSTTTNWAATVAGTAANANCSINATVFPVNGLIFTFAPVQSGPPLPAQSPFPANNAGNVSIGTNLSWVNGGGVPTGYKVFLGTDNPPANIVNGTPQPGTVYDHPVNLSYNTQYYWQIVPYNQDGDAIGCPVWSFSTLADPTITVYPYNQSFDTAIPPGLPTGWSALNLNADAYTWESIADTNANTPPNAMRIRFNPTLVMNDWLISPPMQFLAGALYRIRFYYRSSSESFTERLALYLGSEPTAAAMSTQLFIDDSITNTTYQMVEIDLPVSANSISYLGFKGFSAPGMEYLFLDSFSIEEIGPSFEIDPGSHAFGNVNIGESANQVFTITNPGGGILTINNITISGSPMMSLSNLPTLPASLNHGVSTSFTVMFAPTIAGEHNASVTISDNLLRTDHTISITGTGYLLEAFDPPENLTASVTGNDVHLTWTAPVPSPASLYPRALLGYNIYRDGIVIGSINDPATLSYDDMDLDEGVYAYSVTAFYTSGESIPAGPISVTINEQLLPPTALTGHVENNDVTLTWTSPHPPLVGDWLTWSNDVIGNTIGTNAAAQFIVAQRWDQADLVSYQGSAVARMKFVPAYADCIYTAKVWTGGSATDPGTLVFSQDVTGIVLNEWNLVLLPQSIPIPSVGDLWVGYAVNTQGGYPASVDYGPAVEGKGNMMYFNGEWTTLTNLSSTMIFNWLIEAFVADGGGMKNISPKAVFDSPLKQITSGTLALNPDHKVKPRETTRALTGFRVYRDGALIANLNNPATISYMDMNRENGDYVYGVTAVYSSGESIPVTLNVSVNMQMDPAVFSDSFESYGNFANLFAPWTLLDIDQSPTYGLQNITFPGSQAPMAYIVFNPSATMPPIQGLSAFDGNKMLASFAAFNPPNNDWVITPRINLGSNSMLRFYAKSHTAQYGLERFRVGISTLANIIPEGFLYITGINPIEAPVAWTEYTYDLSAYDNQHVYIGIRCVSNDAIVFYIDKFSVHCVGGSVQDEDPIQSPIKTELKGNYPNPFNPDTTIRYTLKDRSRVCIDIYNVKGQLVRSLVNALHDSGAHSVVWDGTDNGGRALSSGVYYYRMIAADTRSTKKMILMK